MKVYLISGVGRIHFVEVAAGLVKKGVDLVFICGLKPDSFWRLPCWVMGKLLGRDRLWQRLIVRLGPGQILANHQEDFWWPEAVAAIGSRVTKMVPAIFDRTNAIVWRYYGYCLKGRIKTADIFHVRSGAGQGGAIAAAKRHGMRVVVDHSIAHPAEMGRVLDPVFQRFGIPNLMRADSFFWTQVLADCKQADLLLVNSDYVKSTFVANGYPADKVAVLYLGVREDFIGIKHHHAVCKDTIRLLFTGTFDLRKGGHVLIESLRLLITKGVAVELDVAGDATEINKLMHRELAGLPIRVHGYLPQQQLIKMLIDADIYVFPTFTEGCAKSAMEAMVAGVPVITTDACGLPGCPDEHWWRVPAGDPDALSNAIMLLGGDPSKRAAMGGAGIALAQNGDYTWSAYANRLSKLYDDITK
jgi:glycosyltransferase involved in cell wall biosynthesis